MTMATKAQTAAVAAVADNRPQTDIPPPPGGGSWRWDGAAWQPNTTPAEPIVAPIVEEPAATESSATA